MGRPPCGIPVLKEGSSREGEELCTCAESDRTRENRFYLKEGRFRLYVEINSLLCRVERHWNSFPREYVNAPSLETFEFRLYGD